MNIVSFANQMITPSDGRKIAYYDSLSNMEVHDSSKPVIVLLHGYCGSSSYWEQVAPLLQEKARVIIPDLRGHGRSSAPDELVYEMNAFADDLLLLVKEIGVESFSLFGHSLGGYVALAFAERFPNYLRSLSLVHSTSKADSEEAKSNRDKAVEAIRSAGIPSFIDGLVPGLFAPKHVESMQQAVKQMIDIGYGTSITGATATAFGMKARLDRTAVLSQLLIPVLLVAGSEDAKVSVQNVFTASGDYIKQVVLDGMGHMSMVESPKMLADEVSNFMNNLSMS